MQHEAFVTVLGHPRVLLDAMADARRRVLAYDGERVIGVGVYERLFGRQAEAAITIASDATSALVPYLVDGLIDRAREDGLLSVRFVFAWPDQRQVATRVSAGRPDCAVRSDRLDVRAETCHPMPPQAGLLAAR